MIAVRATDIEDLSEIAKFLIRIYKLGATHPLADPKLLEWKYLYPRPGWKGSRSYVLEKNGKIVAHCGVCPVTFHLPDGKAVESLTMTDWAAEPSAAGAGIKLFRNLMAMAPASFVIGGTLMTRQIVPRIGFRQMGEALTYSGWLRPWHEFRVRPLTRRSVLRLAHGWAYPVRNPRDAGEYWDFMQVTRFDDSLPPILSRKNHSWTTCERTLADWNYLLEYPYLAMAGFLLRRQGQLAGYFIVGKAGWEARVLDLFVDSEDADDWKRACGVITKAIQPDPEVCRIRILATVPILQQALLSSGYWCQFKEPIFIYDRQHLLDGAFPVAFQLFDGDSGF